MTADAELYNGAAEPSLEPRVLPGEVGLGLNFIGDITSATGLSVATRATFEALVTNGFPVSLIELLYSFDRRGTGMDNPYRSYMRGNPYPFNLLFYNINELSLVTDTKLWDLTQGKYTIGFWFWELLEIPDFGWGQAERVDEIWVASNYTARSMMTIAKGPVVVIPTPVEVTASPHPDRARYGIPEDRFVYFFNFSAMSSDARKNPWGVVDAFNQAFGRPRGKGAPFLVIKGHHLDRFPKMYRELRARVERVGGMLITADYSRQDMTDLLACSDVYVSLHRCEGFGLGMAESMYLGKPVIATNYSSNTDFMTEENSYLVDYILRPIRVEDHRFSPGMDEIYRSGELWAEPDLSQAIRLMRHIYEHQDEARSRGEQAARDIREFCSPPVVARLIADRLSAIEPRAPRPKPAEGSIGAAGGRTAIERQRNATLQWEDAVTIDRRVPLRRVPAVGQAMRALTRLASLGKSAQAQVKVNRATLSALQAHAEELATLRERIEDLERQNEQLKNTTTVPIEDGSRSHSSVARFPHRSTQEGELAPVTVDIDSGS